MNANTTINSKKVAAAFIVAVLADAIQLPITLAMLGIVTIPMLEAVEIFVDIIAMAVIASRIGFHWILLPSFVCEAIPFVGALPTWTASVAFMTWQQKRAAQRITSIQVDVNSRHGGNKAMPITIPPEPVRVKHPDAEILDAELVGETSQSPSRWLPPPLPAREAVTADVFEARVQRLASLHSRGLISEADFHRKRQQLLNEI